MTSQPVFAVKEFLSASIFNAASTLVTEGIVQIVDSVFYAGLVQPGNINITTSGLTFNADFLSPSGAIFNSGTISYAHGATTGSDTQNYSLNLSSYVPGTGSVTVYIYITPITIQQNPYTVIGPPIGHPSWNPNFVPYTAYATQVDSFTMSASTSGVPGGSLEIARCVLVAGASSLSPSIADQVWATPQLGVPTGTYDHIVMTVDNNGHATFADGVIGSNAPTYSGSGTWTVPAGVYVITIYVWGAGGGGGAAPSGGTANGGGGGGLALVKLRVNPGDSWTYSIGAGGAGSTNTSSGGRGSAGGTTSFVKSDSSISITATGGGGGYFNSGSDASNGIGVISGVVGLVLQGGPADAGFSGYLSGAYQYTGGKGGNCPMGGAGATTATGAAGNSGTLPGGGGGGGGAAQVGGAGANGGIWIVYN